jgi:hypothetical protein
VTVESVAAWLPPAWPTVESVAAGLPSCMADPASQTWQAQATQGPDPVQIWVTSLPCAVAAWPAASVCITSGLSHRRAILQPNAGTTFLKGLAAQQACSFRDVPWLASSNRIPCPTSCDLPARATPHPEPWRRDAASRLPSHFVPYRRGSRTAPSRC